ncbi:hypothetical protein GCM10009551_097940 [Nocardiopsis tropica]
MATDITVDTATGSAVGVCARCNWRTSHTTPAHVWLAAATHLKNVHDDAQGAAYAMQYAKRSRISDNRSYVFSHGVHRHDPASARPARRSGGRGTDAVRKPVR